MNVNTKFAYDHRKHNGTQIFQYVGKVKDLKSVLGLLAKKTDSARYTIGTK